MKNKMLLLVLILLSACESQKVLLTTEFTVNGDIEKELQDIITEFHPNVEMESIMKGLSKSCIGHQEHSYPVFLCRKESKIWIFSVYKPSIDDKYNLNKFRESKKHKFENANLIFHDKTVDTIIQKFKVEKIEHLSDEDSYGEKLNEHLLGPQNHGN